MEKVVGAFEARRSFGQILQDVASRGDNVVVERHGQPIAAVVPFHVYDQWRRRREAFFDHMEEVARRSNLSAGEAEDLIEEVVREVRASHRAQ